MDMCFESSLSLTLDINYILHSTGPSFLICMLGALISALQDCRNACSDRIDVEYLTYYKCLIGSTSLPSYFFLGSSRWLTKAKVFFFPLWSIPFLYFLQGMKSKSPCWKYTKWYMYVYMQACVYFVGIYDWATFLLDCSSFFFLYLSTLYF